MNKILDEAVSDLPIVFSARALSLHTGRVVRANTNNTMQKCSSSLTVPSG